MKEKRSQWASNFGFILAAAGSAVGTRVSDSLYRRGRERRIFHAVGATGRFQPRYAGRRVGTGVFFPVSRNGHHGDLWFLCAEKRQSGKKRGIHLPFRYFGRFFGGADQRYQHFGKLCRFHNGGMAYEPLGALCFCLFTGWVWGIKMPVTRSILREPTSLHSGEHGDLPCALRRLLSSC